MSDKYLQIQNFKWGLETRRAELLTQPGALLVLINGFINKGGAIEQRQSFAKDANAYPADTYGLQDTDSGLVTFGSDAAPIGTLPTGVTYQRLAPPGGGLVPTLQNILFSCNFLGKAFAVGLYSDGKVYCYYNGTLINSSYDGRIFLDTPTTLSAKLAAIVDRFSGWSADANVTANVPSDSSGYHETALNGSTLVMSPGGVHFTPTCVFVSSGGQVGATLIDQNFSGLPSKAAATAFTLNVGTNGTVTVTAPATQQGTGTAQLTNGAVPFNTSLTQTAADVATAINNYTFITGYSAVATTGTVTVFAPASWGNVTFNVTVVTTGDITTVAGALTSLFNISISPFGLDVTNKSNQSGTVHGTINASSVGNTGATGVYYTWDETNADGTMPVTVASGISMSPLSHGAVGTPAASVTFSKFLGVGQSVTGYFQVVATDTGAGAQTNHPVLKFSVSLTLNSLQQSN